MRHLCLLLALVVTSAGCLWVPPVGGMTPPRSPVKDSVIGGLSERDDEAEPVGDVRSHGVVTGPKVAYNPIRPFGSTVVAQEAVVVTADDPNLHYPNGETVPVELGDAVSMKFTRTVGKTRNGELYVDYDIDPVEAPQTAGMPVPAR